MVSSRRDEEFVDYVTARRAYLRRFAYLLCGDWHFAEDIVQNALTKVYLAWPRIRRAGTEEAYVRKVVLRCFLDEKRRSWRRETSVAELPENAHPIGLGFEEIDELRSAVAGLPDRQRAAIVLRHWAGLSMEEIANDLGCSVGTVKSQVSRGVERLRTNLAGDERTARNDKPGRESER